MILGIGTDIVDLARFSPEWTTDRYVRRVFSPDEIAYCRRQYNPAQHFAARFAAKEATIKALGAGGIHLTITQVEVLRDDETSVPSIRLRHGLTRKGLPPLPEWLQIHISIAHDGDYAVAFAVAEINPPTAGN